MKLILIFRSEKKGHVKNNILIKFTFDVEIGLLRFEKAD